MDTGKANNSGSNKIAIWAITPTGAALGLRLGMNLPNSTLFLPKREETYETLQLNGIPFVTYSRLSEEVHRQYRTYSFHIFIFATGIAVRILAPLLKTKISDPAVVVMDETGKFAISLVSGHLGGGNAFAQQVAGLVEATPVITTATDSHGLTSIDLLAQQLGLTIETPENIKHINMKILTDEPFTVDDSTGALEPFIPEQLLSHEDKQNGPDIFCGHTRISVSHETLILRPKVLCLGIGCNRNTPAEEILDLIKSVFSAQNLSLLSLKQIGTSVVKRDEKGLIEVGERLNCPLVFYENQELNSVESIKHPSKMALKHLGVKSVCEAAAILGAQMGPLIITKQKTKNVTLALALVQ